MKVRRIFCITKLKLNYVFRYYVNASQLYYNVIVNEIILFKG